MLLTHSVCYHSNQVLRRTQKTAPGIGLWLYRTWSAQILGGENVVQVALYATGVWFRILPQLNQGPTEWSPQTISFYIPRSFGMCDIITRGMFWPSSLVALFNLNSACGFRALISSILLRKLMPWLRPKRGYATLLKLECNCYMLPSPVF